ncbi:MAG: hypothetical protein JWN84_3709, partial [Nocardioides sp.]|nr:hypothetical protein [Nocardioides sp.]
MSERPGSGSGDGPEFGWLYGRPGGDDQPPDATRKIPVQPRPAGGGAPG